MQLRDVFRAVLLNNWWVSVESFLVIERFEIDYLPCTFLGAVRNRACMMLSDMNNRKACRMNIWVVSEVRLYQNKILIQPYFLICKLCYNKVHHNVR